MKSPFFTIIIPTKNSSQTLARAIESILSQTFADFEILVCDGVSTDNTVSIANSFADERLRIVSKPDRGIYEAMNTGIALGRGEWLYFMGSDDYLWDERVLTDVFQHVREVNPDFVYGNVFSPDLGENYDGKFDVQKLYKKNICHQAVFCKRAVFDKVGMFDTSFRVLADHDFTIRCFHHDEVLKSYLDRKIAYYGPAGASRTVDEIQLITDRYLLTKTVSRFADSFRVERLYERLADQLVEALGVRAILFGSAKSTLQNFLTHDPVLMRRIRRGVLRKMLGRIRK
jgi:glycosyltransferase involved in cell wall biosynthesis